MTFLALIVFAAMLQLVALKSKTYRSAARLANKGGIEEELRWELMGRWGREL